MAALIGLLAGALAGHALWGEWGAIAGGLAGFFAGATIVGKRQRDAHRKPEAARAGATVAHDPGLIERVAKLEARVAALERAQGQAVPPEPATEASGAAVLPGAVGPASAAAVMPASAAAAETVVPAADGVRRPWTTIPSIG